MRSEPELDSQIILFKLRLGALIPRSVGWFVGLSVGLSSKNYKKIIKLYKTSHNLSITFLKTVKAALAVCRSFLDGVVIFLIDLINLIILFYFILFYFILFYFIYFLVVFLLSNSFISHLPS